MQVGKFIVGQPEGSDEIISEEAVPLGQRFPAILKGEGVRGHRYHVFNQPRYVLLSCQFGRFSKWLVGANDSTGTMRRERICRSVDFFKLYIL